ncbi:MAG: hypothetical protein ACK4Y9_13155, partial [Hyphomonas sp.]
MSLKPALTVISLLFLPVSGVALPQPTLGSPMDALYACQSVAGAPERLACFDETVAALKTRETAGEIQTVDVAAIESIEKEAFGLSLPSLPSLFRSQAGNAAERESVSEIVSAVKSARMQGVTGKVIVVLENGQTWE